MVYGASMEATGRDDTAEVVMLDNRRRGFFYCARTMDNRACSMASNPRVLESALLVSTLCRPSLHVLDMKEAHLHASEADLVQKWCRLRASRAFLVSVRQKSCRLVHTNTEKRAPAGTFLGPAHVRAGS